MNTIGEIIKKERESKKLTQTELAKAIGSHVNVIWQYENNKRIPTLENGKKIANVLQIDLNYLLGITPINSVGSTLDDWNKLAIDIKTFLNNENVSQADKDELFRKFSVDYWKFKRSKT